MRLAHIALAFLWATASAARASETIKVEYETRLPVDHGEVVLTTEKLENGLLRQRLAFLKKESEPAILFLTGPMAANSPFLTLSAAYARDTSVAVVLGNGLGFFEYSRFEASPDGNWANPDRAILERFPFKSITITMTGINKIVQAYRRAEDGPPIVYEVTSSPRAANSIYKWVKKDGKAHEDGIMQHYPPLPFPEP